MRYLLLWLLSLASLSPVAGAADAPWIEGQHYFRVEPAQPTQVAPGKVEVVEIFSYACPACNAYYPVMDKLKAALPKPAHLSYLPASWHPEEDWQTFQRAFFAAQSLGLVERTHGAVFDAIWKTGELAIMDPVSKRPKTMMPTIIDVAKFYARTTNVKAAAFVDAAHNFSVDTRMREADAQIRAYQPDGTPTVIIDGRYRLTPQTAGGEEPFVHLVTWLVAQRIAHHL